MEMNMMTTKHALGSALLLLGSYLPAGADETPPAARTQDPEQLEAYGWNGDAPDVDECLTRIAEARVRMQADGDHAGAEALLDEVWLKATATRGFEGQVELLVQVALARAEVYRQQGKQAEALQAAEQLLFKKADLERLQDLRAKLTRANKALLIRAARAANNPRLVALRAELASSPRAADHDSLAKIVRDAYAEEDYGVIVEIGAPAQPAFAAEIVADADTFPSRVSADPLYYLLNMNEGRAAEILLANLDAGGYLWKRRIVRAMDAGNVLNNLGTCSSDQPFVCLEP